MTNGDIELFQQRKNIYSRGNALISKFKLCNVDVKKRLFNTFCTNLYACPLRCIFKSESILNLKVAYNRIYRKLFCITGWISISSHLINATIDPFYVLLRKSIVCFKARLEKSSDLLLNASCHQCFYLYSQMSLWWNTNVYCYPAA